MLSEGCVPQRRERTHRPHRGNTYGRKSVIPLWSVGSVIPLPKVLLKFRWDVPSVFSVLGYPSLDIFSKDLDFHLLL